MINSTFIPLISNYANELISQSYDEEGKIAKLAYSEFEGWKINKLSWFENCFLANLPDCILRYFASWINYQAIADTKIEHLYNHRFDVSIPENIESYYNLAKVNRLFVNIWNNPIIPYSRTLIHNFFEFNPPICCEDDPIIPFESDGIILGYLSSYNDLVYPEIEKIGECVGTEKLQPVAITNKVDLQQTPEFSDFIGDERDFYCLTLTTSNSGHHYYIKVSQNESRPLLLIQSRQGGGDCWLTVMGEESFIISIPKNCPQPELVFLNGCGSFID